MPRAKVSETVGLYTTSSAAEALGLSMYLIKARIADGVLPPPTRSTDSGVLLFDEDWMREAQTRMASDPKRVRRRAPRRRAKHPAPEDVLGFRAGEARKLPDWRQIVDYFEQLANSSDRVDIEVLGESTEGRPYIVVAVSSASNLEPVSRERNRELLGRLWDGRAEDEASVAEAISEARNAGIILATQHSNEIGAAQMTMELAHELASADDKETVELLNATVLYLIPSHNPDGVDMIHDWYVKWLDTPYEGSDLPWLYHPYVGHDNNRDWFMLTQKETGLYIDFHNREHPQAVFDMHQMGRKGARFMVPPFIDPLDPNQDPVIQQGFAAMGTHIAQRLTAAGKSGVVTHAIFDNYSPSLAYGNYHGSVDLLSEAASAKLATPVDLKETEITAEHGFDGSKRLWNHPMPWKGGSWTLRDIVEYDKIAARAFHEHLGQQRRKWLVDYQGINNRVINRETKPFGWVIPPDQRDPASTIEMLEILTRGLVEVHQATRDFEADGIVFPAGSRVVKLDQPAGLYANTLLERQDYPDLRKWPDGPPVPPYDVVGHTLPLQMGVHTVEISTTWGSELPLQPIESAPVWPRQVIEGPTDQISGWVIDSGSNGSISLVAALHRDAVPVFRLPDLDEDIGGVPGDWVVIARDISLSRLQELALNANAVVSSFDVTGQVSLIPHPPRRIGIYQPRTASMDEGWARWLLDHYGVPFTTLTTADVRQGNLADVVDVILIPEMSHEALVSGRPDKNQYGDPWPPEVTGGLGDPGLHHLREFVEFGGDIVAIDSAASGIAEEFALPVRQPLKNVSANEFYCPGSLLRTVVDNDHPLGYGMPRETTVLFVSSAVFESAGDGVKVVARYPHTNPNLSGWISGADKLHGRASLVECQYGDGTVTLFGFRPYFRAQTRSTYRLLFNALWRSHQDRIPVPVSLQSDR